MSQDRSSLAEGEQHGQGVSCLRWDSRQLSGEFEQFRGNREGSPLLQPDCIGFCITPAEDLRFSS